MPPMDNQQKTMMWTNNYMDSGIQSGATTQVCIYLLNIVFWIKYTMMCVLSVGSVCEQQARSG